MLVLFLLKLVKQNLLADTVKNVLTVVVQEKMVAVHTVAEEAENVALTVETAKVVENANHMEETAKVVENVNHTVVEKVALMQVVENVAAGTR